MSLNANSRLFSKPVDAEQKKQNGALLQKLAAALQSAPADKAEHAEAVATQAAQLIEAAKSEKWNKTTLKVIGDGLKQTAKFLKDSVPSAISITGQIVTVVRTIFGIT